MQRAARECKVVECHTLTRETNGYCIEHQAIANKRAIERKKILYNKSPDNASSIYNRFYYSRKWKNKRNSILCRDDYMCLNCEDKAAVHIHHIETVREAYDKRLLSDNLISLCEECHNKTHKEYDKSKQDKIREQERLKLLIKGKW